MVPLPPSAQSQSRSGTFTPVPAQALQTGGLNHSSHPSQAGPVSAGASSSTNSPTTGSNSNNVPKIVIAQVFILLTQLAKDSDRAKWELQAAQLKKLIDENGMEVFSKSFTRLVTQNASTIFPGLNRSTQSTGNYPILAAEMKKISHDIEQAPKIAESIEQGTEDIFRDFDLSTFMEHFKLDALEKTILALAFKFGSRPDLKTKADAILSTNFPTFANIMSRPDYVSHEDLTPSFIAAIVDRYIQGHPPNFNAVAKSELSHKVKSRWLQSDQAPPMAVLAAMDLIRVLGEKPSNALSLYIQRTGADFTRDEEKCLDYLQSRPNNIQLTEEQVSSALTYTTISLTPRHNPSVLVAAFQRILPTNFHWQGVVSYFDQPDVRVSPEQFLRLYNALLPVARNSEANAHTFDIQLLWGGTHWDHPETQLSFVCAYAALTPEELDASTVPGLEPTFSLSDYEQSPVEARERAAVAVKHPLVSVAALSAIFQVALHSHHASQSVEAKRLFQEVVVPNLDIFIVSAFGVPQPWPSMASDTLISLFDNFLHERSEHYDFVLDSLWRKNKEWVSQRLVDAHASKPMDLELIYNHVIKHKWLDDLVYLPNGFGFDLTALAHSRGDLDLAQWAQNNAERGTEIARSLIQFLMIKANMELQYQRPIDEQSSQLSTTSLQIKTVYAMLQIIEDFLEKKPLPELIILQRSCIVVYPRLINYGQGFDDIIDANGLRGNNLPPEATARMEEHYKTMYGNEVQVKDIVNALSRYRRSRDPLEQDIFACMIQGLFDEYTHYVDYPLEALATTAVLFGGIISHKLISDLPLKIALGMVLEAVRDHPPQHPMYKFGLQALMQLFIRFAEWPGFCAQLIQIPGLQETEACKKAEEVVSDLAPEHGENGIGIVHSSNEPMVNGNIDDALGGESCAPPFSAIHVDGPPANASYEEPTTELQDKVQFQLNNLTAARLHSTFGEITEHLDQRHHPWFASHLVEERAKMQPNYHQVYLDFIRLFHDKALSAEILRQTFISTARMLNSESTMANSTERTHLKHLGAWLGLLTIARDQPIKHRNIAFKQLLIEAYDTKRLIVVIPFVCKVLIQGARSTVYRPPNPWLMDILHLLIELYHHAELKLNLKFEIEVLCQDLDLDHQTIEPSQELMNRAPVEDVVELAVPDSLESFENLSLNGMAGGISTGLSPNPVPVAIPEFGPNLQIPPTNEMVVSTQKLREIVHTALSRALADIIQPVVDRSVTIAAISTQQMIHKDFATEPDETRIRASAIHMVKATAGSLALVTSKEPLRANFTNHMRNLSSELPQALPEGTIIMCVNMNIDLACSIIEKQAEDRAVPEIDELIEPELENRRRHRAQRPNEPYVDSGLTRWAMTIPHPYKLSPSMNGLNAEQMAIYEEFARQPRAAPPTSAQPHTATASDATRNIANEILQDQYSSVPNLPTPAETPSLPQLSTQMPYPHVHQGLTNGRPATHPSQVDARGLAERVTKSLIELQRAATESREDHYEDLPRPHPVTDAMDSLTQLIIRTSQNSDDFVFYVAEKICALLFNTEHTLFLESLIRVLESLMKISAGSAIAGALHDRVTATFYQQPPQVWLNLPLLTALLPTELLNLKIIDAAVSKALTQREPDSLVFFEQLLDLTLFNDRPIALFADFIRSLEIAWEWISDEPDLEVGQRIKAKIQGLGLPQLDTRVVEESISQRQEQFEYMFEEWIKLLGNCHVSDKTYAAFAKQVRNRGYIANKDDFMLFVKGVIDLSVAYYEQTVVSGGSSHDSFTAVDALVKLIAVYATENILEPRETPPNAVAILDTALLIGTIVLNHHHVTRGELFNQRVFFRYFSMLMHHSESLFDLSAQGSMLVQNGIEVHRRELLLKHADTLLQIGPARFPGFSFAWLCLIQHRRFLPDLINLESRTGWEPFAQIMVSLLSYAGEHFKTIDVPDVARDFIRAVAKFLVVVQHDYPDFLVANYGRLCASLPPHATQLRNMILVAGPRQEGIDGQLVVVTEFDKAKSYLRDVGLLELLDQLLQDGPSEDAIAHLTHAIGKNDASATVFGNVPVTTNRDMVDAVVSYIGCFAAKRSQPDQSPFVSGNADVATLSLLIHELGPEQRYFVLSRMVDELRFPTSALTHYFTTALLEQWGHDINDPEEVDIRQQLVRILLERFSGYWPQPWGLMYMFVELTKNDKFQFFDQPFIKAAPEIREQFVSIAQNAHTLT